MDQKDAIGMGSTLSDPSMDLNKGDTTAAPKTDTTTAAPKTDTTAAPKPHTGPVKVMVGYFIPYTSHVIVIL